MIQNKPTILIVDDTETNIDILLELLNKYDIAVATDGLSALDIASKDSPDLILLDIMMPEMDGYEVCRKLKKNDDTKNIPIIFITAKTDEDSIEEAYAVGGIDYVTKPFKPRELLARVKTQLKMKALVDNLEYISSYDSMTGIYNRRKFFELANKIFNEKNDDIFATVIDIDKFKNINDKYGHSVGDIVIQRITQAITNSIPKEVIFGRVGGEEFFLLCNAHSQEEVHVKIEWIRKIVEDLEVLTDDGEIIKCTISEGIAKSNKNTKDLDELLKEADKALYEAKGSGRNRVIFR